MADMVRFWEDAAAWHDREAQFCREQSAWCTGQIKQRRAENERVAAYVWDRGVLTADEMKTWGDPKHYRDIGAWDLLKERSRWYRETAAEKKAAEVCRRRAEKERMR